MTTPTGTETDAHARRVWPGAWVQERLEVIVRSTDSAVGVPLEDLVGLAVRRNPRRAHLLVSTVLGKHVPVDPRLVLGAGMLLGRLVLDTLARDGEAGDGARRPDEEFRRAVRGDPGASSALLKAMRDDDCPASPQGTVVLGFAETATALGHAVADTLRAPYLHSTRRPVTGISPVGGFEEEHSHATTHLLLPDDRGLLMGDGPLVLVDDELSTGTTVLNTIRMLHAVHPRRRYVIASLVDLRDDADRSRMVAVADELGVTLDAVALAAGRIDVPADVLDIGKRLVTDMEATVVAGPSTSGAGRVRRADLPWPTGLREGGRHGFTALDGVRLDEALPAIVAELVPYVADRARVHVLGFEELMYAPLRLAAGLAEQLPAAEVTTSTTTRSPVLAVDHEGYAIRSRLVFAAHDGPADGPGERYAYNLSPAEPFDVVVVVIDKTADTTALLGTDGLLTRLAEVVPDVVLAVIPDHRPDSPAADPDA
ncbi:phosphoribosyltransferase family protein [Aeromicrobium sp.]|uniref:phosphoribosyltransferase family protein n=1 Tax=Aeromicrobium sp. TaxID=1871063 RepID=UPI0025C625C1|nr:phosphoribosyltransferase family protein [Aeromicrobium sp.]